MHDSVRILFPLEYSATDDDEEGLTPRLISQNGKQTRAESKQIAEAHSQTNSQFEKYDTWLISMTLSNGYSC